jgi:hypothetical protein
MRRALALALLAFMACGSHHSPTEPVVSVLGRLSGMVTIGPNCPVEQPGVPCPPSPEAYAQRKVLVYDAQHSQLLHTVDIDSQGLYLIDLSPATYVVDLKKVGIDRSGDVPASVTIHANAVTTLNISIDTGLR